MLKQDNENSNQLKNQLKKVTKVVGEIIPEIEIKGMTNKKGMIRKTCHNYPKKKGLNRTNGESRAQAVDRPTPG